MSALSVVSRSPQEPDISGGDVRIDALLWRLGSGFRIVTALLWRRYLMGRRASSEFRMVKMGSCRVEKAKGPFGVLQRQSIVIAEWFSRKKTPVPSWHFPCVSAAGCLSRTLLQGPLQRLFLVAGFQRPFASCGRQSIGEHGYVSNANRDH